jgi:D-arabinose 1-dehydrogenase-like Zn-dependent alcohol dehydrogenase
MRAVVFERYGEPAEVREVPDPRPAEHGVVVRVEATGLCRSDWHGWMGHDPDITLPHVPGHELAGVVEEVGARVTGWRPGDRVTVPFVCGCGSCPSCAAGDHQVCERQTQPGFTHWGSFAQYVALDHADVNLVAVPDDLSYATAASLGCRFATAFRAVVQQGRVAAGEWVAVHGWGGTERGDDRGGLGGAGGRRGRVTEGAGAGARVRCGAVRGRDGDTGHRGRRP